MLRYEQSSPTPQPWADKYIGGNRGRGGCWGAKSERQVMKSKFLFWLAAVAMLTVFVSGCVHHHHGGHRNHHGDWRHGHAWPDSSHH